MLMFFVCCLNQSWKCRGGVDHHIITKIPVNGGWVIKIVSNGDIMEVDRRVQEFDEAV